MVTRIFESRIITVGQYLTISSNNNNGVKFIHEQEQQYIIRFQQKSLVCYHIDHDKTSPPKYLRRQYLKADITAQKQKYVAKLMHEYYERKNNK